jgi:threonine dehydrogenase-like Zn-dependent dehydrogenase
LATVRAVVLAAGGLPELAELPEPTGPGAIVHVRGCGLCGSDVEKLGRAPAGTVLGHEVDGVLEDGTRVTVLHRVPCGACDRCLAGHESTCDAFEMARIDPGGFSERLRATSWLALPGSLGELEGIWVEPLACILRAAESVPRGRVLVVGCGAIGLLWTQVLRARGDAVVAVDPVPERLARAAALGAAVGEGGGDAAVVTAPAGLDAALGRLEPGGTLLVFAAPSERMPVDLDTVYRRELRIVGSRSATPAFFDAALAALPGL